MQVVAHYSDISEDVEVPVPVSNYYQGGIQVVWTPATSAAGRVTIQSDIDGNGVWEEVTSAQISEVLCSLSYRFLAPLPEHVRVKLDLSSGSLERFNVFIQGKGNKDETRSKRRQDR